MSKIIKNSLFSFTLLTLTIGCSQEPALTEYKGDEYFGKNSAEQAYKNTFPTETRTALVPERVVEARPIIHQSSETIPANRYEKDLYKQVEHKYSQPVIAKQQEPQPAEQLLTKRNDVYNEQLVQPKPQVIAEQPMQSTQLEQQPAKPMPLKQTVLEEAESLDSMNNFKTVNPLESKEFEWPVNGKVLSHYGEASGKFKDGMSIAAPQGTPVKAAANGEVIYVGNDAGGFGHLVIVKHDNDIMTAYAHNNSVLVQKGQQVTKGQVISKVGKTGGADSSQLYFSIRKGKNTLNPEAMAGR